VTQILQLLQLVTRFKMFCCFLSALQIFESNKTCEIDPVKLKEGDNVEVNKVIFLFCFRFLVELLYLIWLYVSDKIRRYFGPPKMKP